MGTREDWQRAVEYEARLRRMVELENELEELRRRKAEDEDEEEPTTVLGVAWIQERQS